MSAGSMPAAQRIGQHPLGERGDERIGPAQDGARAARRAHRPSCRPPARRRRRSARHRRPASRHCPTELKFSSAKPGGSMMRWQEAHGRHSCGAAPAAPAPSSAPLSAPLLLSSSVGTFGGGGGGGVLRNVLRMNLPRNTGEVLVATDGQRQDAPLPEQAAPVRIGQLHLAEARRRRRPECRSAWPAAR